MLPSRKSIRPNRSSLASRDAAHNCERPHSSLDSRTPKEFGDIARCKLPPSAGAAAASLEGEPLRPNHTLKSNRVEDQLAVN